jgi:hypothetical protein
MKKIILWSIVLVVIAGVSIGVFLRLHKPQVITLAGGTKLTFVGVTYGKHHVAPKITVAGKNTRGNGGARLDTDTDTVVVWIEAETKLNQSPDYELMVYDTAGTACVSVDSSMDSQIKNGVQLQGFALDAYPRWDSKFIVRAKSWNGNERVSKEQFVVSNPARGKSSAKWTPEPLPDTQSDGDLDVTLTKLVYGVSDLGSGNGSSKDPANKAVLTAFHTEQKGVTMTNWAPIRIETSDATGNKVENNSWSSGRDDNGDATMTYQWGLWPDHTPWKLHVEFSKKSGFSDDELWTIQDVPVNPGSQQLLWNYNNGRSSRTNSAFAETTLSGFHLKLYPVIQFTDQNPGNGEKRGGFRVRADQALDGMQMTLVKATDEQGRNVQSWDGESWGGDSRQFQFQNLRNAKKLNIIVALHKSHFVDFTAKPGKQ